MAVHGRDRLVSLALWQAATCCSGPTLDLAVGYHAWPITEPFSFTITVIVGATMALLAFHLLPALLAREWLGERLPSLLYFPALAVALWYAAGAGTSFLWLCHRSGQILLWTPSTSVATGVVAIGCGAVMVLMLGRAGPRLQSILAASLTAVPLVLLAATVIGQWQAMSIRNPQLVSERDLNNNLAVLRGVLLAAAPTAIFGFAIGRDKPPLRTIIFSGFATVWLPLVVTIVLASLAKVTGTRLYWRPSLPIGVEFSLGWFVHNILPDARIVILLMILAPMATTSWWCKEALPLLNALWMRVALFASPFLIFVAVLRFRPEQFEGYYTPWCWTVLIGVMLLSVALRPRTHGR